MIIYTAHRANRHSKHISQSSSYPTVPPGPTALQCTHSVCRRNRTSSVFCGNFTYVESSTYVNRACWWIFI